MAVAAIPLRWHAAEALLEVDMPQAAMLMVAILEVATLLAVATLAVAILEAHMPAVAMAGQEGERMALGVAETSPAPAPRIVPETLAIGVAEIGTGAITGTAAAVTGEIRMGGGVGGMATDSFTPGLTLFSSVILAFPGGGVGAGARGQVGDGVTRMDMEDMDITVMTIPTTAAVVIPTMATAMGTVMATTDTEMDMERSTNLSTEVAANPESPSCNGGCHGLVITMDPLTESSGHKPGAQSGRTSKSTEMWVNRILPVNHD